jgi:gas vesicle protein
MNPGKILMGVLAGLSAGALLGILFAPDKGSRTRRRILEKGEDYANDLKEKLGEYCEAVVDKFESIQKNAEEAVDKGKMKYESAKKEARNMS